MLLVRAAPVAWRLEWWHGPLLGAALYMGALSRWMTWRLDGARGGGGGDGAFSARTWTDDAWDLGWRAAVFLALFAGQAYAYFEWLPRADLRASFVMLSVWIVAETMLAPREAPTVASGPSRRA